MSTNIISQKTAGRVWNAHREIEVATKLRADMQEAIDKGEDPNPRDAFGRRQNLSLGVPSGHNSERMFDVEPKLAIHIISAHIAAQEKELADASIAARLELEAANV